MTLEDLGKVDDKMSIFNDFNLLLQYIKTLGDLQQACIMYLNDEQKLEVMQKDYFINQGKCLADDVIMSISDLGIRVKALKALAVEEDMISKFGLASILNSLDDATKLEIIKDEPLIRKYELSEYILTPIICLLDSDEEKVKIANMYGIQDMIAIYESFSSDNKCKLLIDSDINFSEHDIKKLINSFDINNRIEFLINNQDFLQEKGIKILDLIKSASSEKQIEYVTNISKLGLDDTQTRICIVSIGNDAKAQIDRKLIEDRYRELLDLKLKEEIVGHGYGQIIPSFDGNLEKYRGLDSLLYVNPLDIEDPGARERLPELLAVCPNICIHDELSISASTAQEYIEGEEWVSEVIDGINEEWSDVQKMAYIHTAIGKRISYSPDFDTEVSNVEGARSLWKIMAKGYGVCNGIAQVEKYLFSKVGIESEVVSGERHAFVKVKNVEVPTKDGTKLGDTLLDPTWDLAASRYGARPMHFCKSYAELRKFDFDQNGKDQECHLNDELQNVTIEMDVETLRKVFTSIGIADREGNFPILAEINKVAEINDNYKDVDENVSKKLELLKECCPEFATCINSTMSNMQVLFENTEGFSYDKCVTSRVYDRDDEAKSPVLYLYLDFGEGNTRFFYADKGQGEFIAMSKQEFEERFECYETDLQRANGKRPWEVESEEPEHEDKSRSSGKIVAGEER